MRHTTCLLLAVVFSATACSQEDPTIKPGTGVDEPIVGAACASAPNYTEDLSSCTPLVTDYQPRAGEKDARDWPNCISDDNTYVKIQDSISSIARVAAGDAVATILWDGGILPTSEDFLQARIVYAEDQGLGSRVARRWDPHYTAPASGKCDEVGVADANPDYCVGPAKLLPIIVDAFAEGALGKNRLVNAARIQAAIQWFFYVSANKEASTCTDKAKDCDSAWAYYTGGTERDSPRGLAADVDALAPGTHDRAYDGALALRCWRDLENDDTKEATAFLSRRDLALAQYDRAMVRGMAVIIRQKFAELACATGDYKDAAHAALKVLVPLLSRETRARDGVMGTTANLLKTEVEKDVDAVDTSAAIAAIDAMYACP